MRGENGEGEREEELDKREAEGRQGGRQGGSAQLTLLRLLRSLTLFVSCWISATWSASRFCSFSFSASVSSSVRASCKDSLSGWPLGVFFSMSCKAQRAGTGNPSHADPPWAEVKALTATPPAPTGLQRTQLAAGTQGPARDPKTQTERSEENNHAGLPGYPPKELEAGL